MYAVVRTGGKQYRVEAGSMLVVEKLGGEPGSQVTFDRVLLVGDGDAVTVGNPTVAGATVSGTVLGESLGAKIVVFKFKQKVKYRRRTGHRQRMTRVRIDAITADGKTVRAESAPAPRAVETSESPAEPAAKPKARGRTRAAAAADKATTPATKAKRRAAAKATEAKPADAKSTGAKPARRSRAKAVDTAAESAEATPSAGEEKPKPRTRRAAKPKTDSAKEE
jgi:large subunit ribosomal protein L21